MSGVFTPQAARLLNAKSTKGDALRNATIIQNFQLSFYRDVACANTKTKLEVC